MNRNSTERTPLQQPPSVVAADETMKSFVTKLLTKENLAAASSAAQARLAELWDSVRARPTLTPSSAGGDSNIREGDNQGGATGGWNYWSLRVVGLASGAMLVMSSMLGTFVHFFTLRWAHIVIDALVGASGVTVIVLEFPRNSARNRIHQPQGQQPTLTSSVVKTQLYAHAPFLRFAWGRGCLLSAAGSIQVVLSGGGPLRWTAGALALVTGVAYVYVGWSAAHKLAAATRASASGVGSSDAGATADLFGLSEPVLRDKFREANASGTGNLTEQEFSNLLSSLGANMNRAELEAAYLHVSQDSDSIPFDRFRSWCDGDSVTLIV